MDFVASGKRVKIRKALSQDADILCKWYSDGRIMIHVGYPDGLIENVENIRKNLINISSDNMLFIIVDEDNEPIGECNYKKMEEEKCSIGIKICELDYLGKGYGEEALKLFLNYLFNTLNTKDIYLDTLIENVRAQNLYKKVGFKELRINKDCWVDPAGKSRSAVEMLLTRDEFVLN